MEVAQFVESEISYKILVDKQTGEQKPRKACEDSIKTQHGETVCEDGRWMVCRLAFFGIISDELSESATSE